MGIPYYFYVIAHSYDGILLHQLPKNKQCNHLFLDFNGLIHPASHKYLHTIKETNKIPKDIEKGILSSVWNELKESVSLVKPQDTVQIFIDGVAPIAKMFQQRKRRYLSMFRKKQLNDYGLWDSNAISPGTTFMTRLHASLRAHIRQEKEKYTYYLSTSDDVGEGEHKLFDRMKRLYNNPDEVKVIHGLDADLIMLSLLSHMDNIYLMRVDNDKGENNTKFLDITALRRGIIDDLKNNYEWDINNEITTDLFSDTSKHIIETYVILCFILGNDFIPHPINVSLKKGGINKIIHSAKFLWNSGVYLIDIENKKINWNFVKHIFEELSRDEDERVYEVVEEYYTKRAYNIDNEENKLESYPILRENKDILAETILYKIPQKKWRLYYYKHLFNTKMNDTKVIKSSCELFLKGILWTYHYYKGYSKDDRWYYPYSYAPTLKDLSNYLSDIQYFETLQNEWLNKKEPVYFTNQIAQLLSILPKESKTCIPNKYATYMDSNELSYMYPSEYKLQTFMKNKLWECTPMLPPLDIERVEDLIKPPVKNTTMV
jgi:5'-3' exonuclease